jgi:WD40 repeat protein
MWKLSEEALYNQAQQVAGSYKRQKTEISTFNPQHVFHVNGGVESLEWLDGDTLIAGCQDHALKLIDIEKSYVIKQSILTSHKVPSCMDTANGNLILMGSEDACIRLFDTRAG